jgi:hypothetical protein
MFNIAEPMATAYPKVAHAKMFARIFFIGGVLRNSVLVITVPP